MLCASTFGDNKSWALRCCRTFCFVETFVYYLKTSKELTNKIANGCQICVLFTIANTFTAKTMVSMGAQC